MCFALRAGSRGSRQGEVEAPQARRGRGDGRGLVQRSLPGSLGLGADQTYTTLHSARDDGVRVGLPFLQEWLLSPWAAASAGWVLRATSRVPQGTVPGGALLGKEWEAWGCAGGAGTLHPVIAGSPDLGPPPGGSHTCR